MPTLNVDGDLLRRDLLDYYGTAAFSGFPVAMMDVFAVERMSGEELWAQAERNGFRMERYVTGVEFEEEELYRAWAAAFASSAYVPCPAPVRTGPSKEDLSFPTYENAVRDSFFTLSPEARRLASSRPARWERLLFAQELQDFSYQLGKLKKQTPDNPYVQAIGTESQGRPLLYYFVALADNLSRGIERAGKAADEALPNVGRALSARNGEEAIRRTAVALTEPFRIFLGLYNDISLVEIPEEYGIVCSEYRKALKSLLSDCELFYYELAEEIGRGADSQPKTKLRLHAFHTKKISDAVVKNADRLRECGLVRKSKT